MTDVVNFARLEKISVFILTFPFHFVQDEAKVKVSLEVKFVGVTVIIIIIEWQQTQILVHRQRAARMVQTKKQAKKKWKNE